MSYMNAVTPPQARCHWCPFARGAETTETMAGVASAGTNRYLSGAKLHKSDPLCIAHRCMAWRWAGPVVLRNRATPETGIVEPPRPEGVPESWVWQPPDEAECLPGMWIESEEEAAERGLGYCALAGDPAQRQTLEGLTHTLRALDNTTQRLVAATARYK